MNTPTPTTERPLDSLTTSDRLRAIGDAWSMAELERRRDDLICYDDQEAP